MSKLSVSILFALALVFSGCTVHHYHHNSPDSGKKMNMHKKKMKMHKVKMMKKHHGGGYGELPAGHPPVDGMDGHSKKGHGMKGYGTMPKGHGKKSHGPMPKGHPPVGHSPKGHHSGGGPGDVTENPFQDDMGHDERKGAHAHEDHKKNLPPEIVAYRDSFAAAWHKEDDASRRTAACGQIAEWKKLAQAVKKLRGGAVLAAATKDLQKETIGVAGNCARKNGDVQAALTKTHDALQMLFRVAAKPPKTHSAKVNSAKKP